MKLSLSQIAQMVGGKLNGEDALVTSVSIDSRTITPNALYVPIIGASFDGHFFIPDAMQKGAVGCLSQIDVPSTHIRVDSTLRAFQALARCYRNLFDIPLVGITGSVGKTTTKEMVYSVLSQQFNTLKTKGNLNNQTGVPQVLLSLDSSHEAAIIEMGTNHFGEIDALAAMAQPTICLFTNIGTAHIEFLHSCEGILQAKAEMLKHKREGGLVIVNGDDALLNTLDADVRYGFGENCDVRAMNLVENGVNGTAFTAQTKTYALDVCVPVAGKHMVLNALAAIVVGSVLNVPAEKIKRGIEAFVPAEGRAQILHRERCTVINDAYNANPTSMKATLEVLSSVKGRKVAILGDMGELGVNSVSLHNEVADYALNSGIDLLILVGKTFGQIDVPNALQFGSRDELLTVLPKLLQQGDTVLIKASHSMHFETLLEHLI